MWALFYDAISISDYVSIEGWYDWWVKNGKNLEGSSFALSRYSRNTCFEGLKETVIDLSHGSWCLNQETKQAPPTYKLTELSQLQSGQCGQVQGSWFYLIKKWNWVIKYKYSSKLKDEILKS